MTPVETLNAVQPGKATDRKLTVGPSGDVVVTSVVTASADGVSLVRVDGPFARCVQRRIPILEMLSQDPESGNLRLNQLCDEIRSNIFNALEAGADGIAYVVAGANPEHMSPMSYGGHFLERDRQILSAIPTSAYVLVAIVGGAGTYLDFVSDLPGQAFAWDAHATGVTVDEMRSMRPGVLASTVDDADLIVLPSAGLLNGLETQTIGTH